VVVTTTLVAVIIPNVLSGVGVFNHAVPFHTHLFVPTVCSWPTYGVVGKFKIDISVFLL
jgi:hypothetical protein